MRIRSLLGTIVILGLGVVLVAGCADKLTRAHYDMIVLNTSTCYDVEKTIGDPSQRLDDEWLYERTDKHLIVKVHFNDSDVVTRKQWIDAMGSEWHDTQEAPKDRDVHETTEVRTIND